MSDPHPDDAARYRSLFEGSQASLTDMAARHAQALGRVGRLRSAIVNALRKNFMELSAQAEANLGRRLSEVDDEILLAYLDAFTGMASRSDQRATLQALGEAIATLGIPLRGDDPLVWVEQIHRHRQEQRQREHRDLGWGPAAETSVTGDRRPTASSPDGGRTARQEAPGRADQRGAPPTDAAARDVEDYWQWDERPSLHELFADTPSTQPTSGDQVGGGVDSLGGLFRDITDPPIWDGVPIDETTERWTPSPVRPSRATEPARATAPVNAPAAGPVDDSHRSSTGGGRRKNRGQESRDNDQDRNRSGHPGDERHADDPTTPAAAETAEGKEAAEAPVEGRRRPTAEPTAGRQHQGSPEPGPPEGTGELVAVGDEEAQRPASTGAGDSRHEEAHTGDDGGRSMPEPDQPGEEPHGPAVRAGSTGAPAARLPDVLVGQPLRPELFPTAPTTKKPRKGRTVRTQAQPPQEETSLLDAVTDGSASGELDDQLRGALLAAASIPRPVFTRDLVAVAGDVALVDSWEAECRANVSTSPVRFVVPKSRHRLRGRLVAVEPETVKPTDWWYQAVSRYRAGRLYELGVLLHRIGDEVVSFQLDEHVALFRLNTQRGLVGVVVSLEARLADTPDARAQLADALERLLSERLTMLTVLAASAEQGALEQLIAVVEDASRERRFTPTFPMLAGRSWEYADDRGSSAVLIQGES